MIQFAIGKNINVVANSATGRTRILPNALYFSAFSRANFVLGILIGNRHKTQQSEFYLWHFYLAFVTGKQHKHTTNNTINTHNEEKMKTADKASINN